MQADIVRCYNDSFRSGYLAELVYSTGEQIQALMLLPDTMVVAWLLVHMRFLYIANSMAKAPPSLLFAAVWWLAQWFLPRLLFNYMTKTAGASLSRAVAQSPTGDCLAIPAPDAVGQVAAGAQACDASALDGGVGTSRGDGKLRQKQQAAGEDLAAIQAAKQPAQQVEAPDSTSGVAQALRSAAQLDDVPSQLAATSQGARPAAAAAAAESSQAGSTGEPACRWIPITYLHVCWLIWVHLPC